ncbi:hypothetical protein D3C86_1701400 [compost metagenome]
MKFFCTPTVLVLYPKYETSIVFPSVTESSNSPSKLETVAFFVAVSKTVTPGIGTPFSSIIFPLILIFSASDVVFTTTVVF